MPAKKLSFTKGITLVELLIYVALLGTVLTILYQFFAQISLARLNQISQTAIDSNGQRVIFELTQTIKQASIVDQPVLGTSSNTLSLNGGEITYSLDSNNRLVKNQGGQADFVTDNQVVLENLVFSHLGPASDFPTVKITFDLKSRHFIEGQPKQTSFQTAASLR